MRWLKRSLWLLAWSLWAWLGLGLYRELPRELTLVRELSPGGTGMYRGFDGNTNHIVVFTNGMDGEAIRIHVIDAESGALVTRAEGPPVPNVWCSSPEALRHGVLIATRKMDDSPRVSVHVFDIAAGRWRKLTETRGNDFYVHPTRPWVVFNESPKSSDAPWRVVAMDFKTGREIFVRDLPMGAPIYRNPYFVGDDRILVQLTAGTLSQTPPKRTNQKSNELVADPAESKLTHSLEIWRVANPPVLEKSIENACMRYVRSVAADGRLAYSGAPMEPSHGVYDLAAERTVFTHPFNDEEFDDRFHRGGLGPPKLSLSGRTVLGGNPRTLREVDTKRLIWGPPIPDFWATYGTDNEFQVLESWHSIWNGWLPNHPLQTRAVRSMETGELIYRTTWADAFIVPHLFNADRTLAVANGGRVYRMPARVNWPLFAFCQVVLALPLVALCGVLRWRRRGLRYVVPADGAVPTSAGGR